VKEASGALAGIELLSKHLKNYKNFESGLVYSQIYSYSCCSPATSCVAL
jgi:hypothetical protein